VPDALSKSNRHTAGALRQAVPAVLGGGWRAGRRRAVPAAFSPRVAPGQLRASLRRIEAANR